MSEASGGGLAALKRLPSDGELTNPGGGGGLCIYACVQSSWVCCNGHGLQDSLRFFRTQLCMYILIYFATTTTHGLAGPDCEIKGRCLSGEVLVRLFTEPALAELARIFE